MTDPIGDSPTTPPPPQVPEVAAAKQGPAIGTLIAGILGAACFVASLATDWQKTTIDITPDRSPMPLPKSSDLVLAGGLVSSHSLGLVYLLGALAMLAFVGAVISRRELAARFGWAVAGVTVGLLGVLIAVTLNLSDMVDGDVSPFSGLLGLMSRQDANVETIAQPGLFFGYATVLLLMLAVALSGATRYAGEGERPAR